MRNRNTAIVVGGGIGGLTAAIALKRLGMKVRVYERTHRLATGTTGIILAANAMRVLDLFDLGHTVRHLGPWLQSIHLRDTMGHTLTRISLQERNIRDVPALCLQRSRLYLVLADALGHENIVKGCELTSLVQDQHGVTARFRDGSESFGHLLIGSDGLHSRVRAQLNGQSVLNYAGFVCWRGISSREDLLESGALFESFGGGLRFGAVRIGGGQVYWYACANLAPSTHFGLRTQEELMMRFFHFHHPITSLIESTDEIITDPCYDRDPLESWSRGRVTLLGDAAHPITPTLGQGACMAIEDCLVLAQSLKAETSLEQALLRYEQKRRPRTSAIQRHSRLAGRVGQLENPLACRLRNTVLKLASPHTLQKRYGQWFGLQALA